MADQPTDDRFYGRRKGKPLRAARRRLYETLLPALALPDGNESLDPGTVFDQPRQVWLEIGFGGGEHLVGQAKINPDIGLIGAEVFEYGVGKALSQIEAERVSNVRLWPEDVRPLLNRLPDACLYRIFVLFPDPWPKARHAKRRMIQPERLSAFSRLLRPSGELWVASDDPGYIEWTLLHASEHPDFITASVDPEHWRAPPADWVETRYEQKAKAAGRRPAYMVFPKRT